MRCAALLLALVVSARAAPDKARYFKIRVVDEETGRGVPLVELRTTGGVRYYTDSNGIVAFHEPGLMGSRVFFHVQSHGYEFRPDPFKFRGVRTVPVAGGSLEIKIRRVNVAERLYRLTGGGIYRDSVLLGEAVPIRQAVLNGRVLGQDSVQTIPYRGKLYWFWGDTNRVSYPLGNFAASGATSPLGVDPEKGVDLAYFVDKRGFSRPMCVIKGPGPKWIDGLMILDGRLLAHYVRVKKLGVLHERGLVLYNDAKEVFEKLVELPIDLPLHPHGHPQRIGGHYYFGAPFPNVRVPADVEKVKDVGAYEAFTFGEGGYRWRKGVAPASQKSQARLVKQGKLAREAAWLHLRDVETGKRVHAHNGSVFWNEYRQRFVAIFSEAGGTSFLGEIWYAEADHLLGPWVYARKIVTHDRYAFYNPKHHPYFDREKGRRIYFEGTYTTTFSATKVPTPRYNYNQIMYRLDLADPRAFLPVPVYRLKDGTLGTRAAVAKRWDDVEAIAFFAMDRARPDLVGMKGGYFALKPRTPSNSKDVIETEHGRVWRNPMGRFPLSVFRSP